MKFAVTAFDEVSSTNDVVKRAIDEGAPEGFAAVARRQTGGYGRQGRHWASPEGGLYLSVLLRPQAPPAELPVLSLVAGTAVRRAICRVAGAAAARDVLVKWPNDVVLRMPDEDARAAAFAKLCGISLERHHGALCVGIGVNVHAPEARVEVGGKNEAAYAERIAAAGRPVTIAGMRDAVLDALGACYEQWQRGGFASFVAEYNEHGALSGRPIAVELNDGRVSVRGVAHGADAAGRLVVVAPDGRTIAVSSGEAHIAA